MAEFAPKLAVFFDLGETLITGAPAAWVPGARAVLAHLQSQGVGLGLLSNTAGLDRHELVAYLPADFDFADFAPSLVLLSGETGLEKPDPRAFTAAVDRAGADTRAVLVTEDLRHAMVAQTVGMLVVRLVSPPRSDLKDVPAVLRAAGLIAG